MAAAPFLNLALLGWQLASLAAVRAAPSPHPVVVLIAFDGVPHNYLELGHTPFLRQLAADSATAEWMLHQTPPQSLPNLQSIATGLYPHDHGVRGDHVLAAGTDLCLGYGLKMYTQRADVLPIWTLNELTGGGRYSGVSAWPGFEFVAHNATSPTFQTKATDCKSWEKRVDDVAQWLTDDRTPANLVLAHFEHNQTRSAQSVPQIMRQIDAIVKYYFEQLHHRGIRDLVNTIVVSDHTRIDGSVGVMPECGKRTPNDNSSCHAEIWKNLEEATKRLNAFKLTQYAKLKSNFESAGISNEAEQYLNAQHIKLFEHPVEFLRALGEDDKNSGMFPLFIANGPLFEPKYKAAPFDNVDIYALLAKKLELIAPKIPINGSYESIKDVLVKDKPVYEDMTFKVILYILVALLLLACGWYILRIRKQERLRF